jgi:hypothetical protein
MDRLIAKAKAIAQADPHLAQFDVRSEGNELHLMRKGESFARLVPASKAGQWRMEYFLNRERWEIIDFSGTLEECLAFLAENPHYLFWE